jgi:ubiquinone/menaquinone biosynthesis C-methylase UbiE
MADTTSATYEAFATQVEYVALNAAFVDVIVPRLGAPRVVADVACGTGTMSGLLVSALTRDSLRPIPVVVGVDRARDSLQVARAASLPGRACWTEGSADRLPLRDEAADVAIIGNAIHLLDTDRAVAEIRRVLRPGGVFAFNTTYHDAGSRGEMRRFYGEFFGEARRQLKAWRLRAAPADDTRPGARSRVPAPRLTSDEYLDLTARHGFTVTHAAERTVHLTRANFEAIAVYGEFAAQWSAYPPDVVVSALTEAVRIVWERFELTTLARPWLEVVAVRH